MSKIAIDGILYGSTDAKDIHFNVDEESSSPLTTTTVEAALNELNEKIEDGGGGSSYTLPIASSDILGGIKIGENLTIDEDGVVSASESGTTVEANPEEESTETLNKIKIGETTYEIEGGSSLDYDIKEITKAAYDSTPSSERTNIIYFIKDWTPGGGGGGGGSSYTIYDKETFDAMTVEEINTLGVFGVRTGYHINFIDGTYYRRDLVALIPTLTSDVGENGTAKCPLSAPVYNGKNTSYTSYAYYAFDNSDSTYLQYYGENQSGAYCEYEFSDEVYIESLEAKIGHYSSSNSFNYFLQYYDEQSSEWKTVGNGTHTGAASVVKHTLEGFVSTKRIRFYSTTQKTSGTNIFLYQLQAYGWA